jgi:23S rRNA (cytosine1962-C5)-methyltransferase
MRTLELLTPEHFRDYQLLDCGGGEKLERFGTYVLIRPEPQAVWRPALTPEQWQTQAHVRFEQRGSHSGSWAMLKQMPERWTIRYQNHDLNFQLRLALTAFKHVGVFPEQASNWDFIFAQTRRLQSKGIAAPKVLNLFAYTGGASMAAKAAGASVTHVDSVKQVVNWAADNLALNHWDGVRWLVEDALKFIKREARRGSQYQGVLLDPPAFGHGPNGERWKLEEMIDELVQESLQLIPPEDSFLLLNCYSLGFSALVVHSLLQTHMGAKGTLTAGELYLPDTAGRRLPTGVVARLVR